MLGRAALSMVTAPACLSLALAQDVPVTRSGGDFDSAISFTAPKLVVRTPGAVGHETIGVTVQASKIKATGEIQWYLVLGGEYQSIKWRRYGGISLPGGVQLPGDPLRADVLSCSGYGLCGYYEIVTVALPSYIVKKATSEGIHLRWNAEMLGAFELRVPASHFTAVDMALHPQAKAPISEQSAGTGAERSRDERSIEECWEKQAGVSNSPPDIQRLLIAVCEWGEAEYYRKYGRHFTKSGEKP